MDDDLEAAARQNLGFADVPMDVAEPAAPTYAAAVLMPRQDNVPDVSRDPRQKKQRRDDKTPK